MQYELNNPSDPYTFEASDRETAALTVFLLSTAYGASPETGNEDVPIFIFGGAAEWYQKLFGRDCKTGLDEKLSLVSDALDSFMLGHFEDRRRYNAALAAIDDPAKCEAFKEEWQDGRSSLNDIGTVAHKLSIQIREAKEPT